MSSLIRGDGVQVEFSLDEKREPVVRERSMHIDVHAYVLAGIHLAREHGESVSARASTFNCFGVGVEIAGRDA